MSENEIRTFERYAGVHLRPRRRKYIDSVP